MTVAIPRVEILGVGVSTVDMESAISEIQRWITEGERHYVCVTGVHGIMESQRDPELKQIHNQSGLTTPDGMSTVWAAHYVGARDTTRVYGPELMPEVCRRGAALGWRMYLYGGAPGVPEELEARLVELAPGLQVVGTYSPPFGELSPEEDAEIVERINRAEPDIVWVGLSTPKQERWMSGHRDALNAPALIGVGAAFDFLTDRVKQAPPWIRGHGLEWAYRVVQEPRRLFRRYFDAIPRYVWGNVRNPPRLVEPWGTDEIGGGRGTAERSSSNRSGDS
jgi:N-acetylglucosaminyldiphosphoundecaprenol N-acetyl-beta-D-mannosaminyltransferase